MKRFYRGHADGRITPLPLWRFPFDAFVYLRQREKTP